jgi:hypothetical protein
VPDQQIFVNCYNESGVLADSEFMLGYHLDGDASFKGNGAYAKADMPSAASYTPSATYSYNASPIICGSTEPPISAGRVSAGTYVLHFEDKIWESSTVHVTGYGTTGYCKIGDLSPTVDGSGNYDIDISVLCFDANGDPADAIYVASYSTNWEQNPCAP